MEKSDKGDGSLCHLMKKTSGLVQTFLFIEKVLSKGDKENRP